MTTYSSRAEVVTDAPARYAKQLVAHLGRKVPFTTDGPTATAALGVTTAAITVADNLLVLTAAGPDPDEIARAEHVLGGHLERFGARLGLTVTWARTTTAAPATASVAADVEGTHR